MPKNSARSYKHEMNLEKTYNNSTGFTYHYSKKGTLYERR